jgi:hypothetical protein
MPFKRQENERSLELVSLIDIVFLLLLFFLVSFAFTLAGDDSEMKIYSEIDLPKTETALPAIKDDILENLMIQIVPDTSEFGVSRRVYVLWPSFEDTAKVSRLQAFHRAAQDSTFAVFPPDFILLPDEEFAGTAPCTLITNSIARYVEREKFYRGNSSPIVEVRAEQNTEFKIINFIMDVCSSQQQAIPQIIIRAVL